MTIHYITNSRLPTEKAFGYGITKMCEAFAAEGHDVVLHIPERIGGETEGIFEYYGVQNNFRIRTLWSLDTFELLPRFPKLAFAIQSFTFFLSALFMPIQANDILYTRDLFALPLLRLKSKHVYLEIHLLQRIHRRLAGLFRFAKHIFTTTQELKNEICSFGIADNHVTVAHDAVDLAAFGVVIPIDEAQTRLGLPRHKRLIGYTGNFKAMGMDKGIKNILLALPIVVAAIPDVIFVAVGGNETDIAEYQTVAQSNGVPDHVLLFPRVHVSELPVWQQACEVLLMCPPNTEYFAHHVSPLKMFEYMAADRPVVASDLPGFREVLDETTALLVNADDPHALATMIIRALTDHQLAEQIAHAAKIRAEEFTWDARAIHILTELQ